MTESRIKEIAKQHHCDWVICHEAMKQAVNEALDEAAKEVLAVNSTGWPATDDDILNLKVE